MRKRKAVTVSQVLDFMLGASPRQNPANASYGDQVHKARERELLNRMERDGKDGKATRF